MQLALCHPARTRQEGPWPGYHWLAHESRGVSGGTSPLLWTSTVDSCRRHEVRCEHMRGINAVSRQMSARTGERAAAGCWQEMGWWSLYPPLVGSEACETASDTPGKKGAQLRSTMVNALRCKLAGGHGPCGKCTLHRLSRATASYTCGMQDTHTLWGCIGVAACKSTREKVPGVG